LGYGNIFHMVPEIFFRLIDSPVMGGPHQDIDLASLGQTDQKKKVPSDGF